MNSGTVEQALVNQREQELEKLRGSGDTLCTDPLCVLTLAESIDKTIPRVREEPFYEESRARRLCAFLRGLDS